MWSKIATASTGKPSHWHYRGQFFTELFANVIEPLVKKNNERLRDSSKNVAIKQKKILSLVLKA